MNPRWVQTHGGGNRGRLSARVNAAAPTRASSSESRTDTNERCNVSCLTQRQFKVVTSFGWIDDGACVCSCEQALCERADQRDFCSFRSGLSLLLQPTAVHLCSTVHQLCTRSCPRVQHLPSVPVPVVQLHFDCPESKTGQIIYLCEHILGCL